MKYVSINAHTIRRNAVAGTRDSPIQIARTKSDAKPEYASEVEILDAAGKPVGRLVYDPEKKILRCGARTRLRMQQPSGREMSCKDNGYSGTGNITIYICDNGACGRRFEVNTERAEQRFPGRWRMDATKLTRRSNVDGPSPIRKG